MLGGFVIAFGPAVLRVLMPDHRGRVLLLGTFVLAMAKLTSPYSALRRVRIKFRWKVDGFAQ